MKMTTLDCGFPTIILYLHWLRGIPKERMVLKPPLQVQGDGSVMSYWQKLVLDKKLCNYETTFFLWFHKPQTGP